MKKIILIISLVITSLFFLNANSKQLSNQNIPTPKNLEVVDPYFCWDFANAVEADYCGYVGCNYDIWEYAFANCMLYSK